MAAMAAEVEARLGLLADECVLEELDIEAEEEGEIHLISGGLEQNRCKDGVWPSKSRPRAVNALLVGSTITHRR